ncbi:MAG: hypothetical protein AAF533_03465 [Acidobacteriota bacterium]
MRARRLDQGGGALLTALLLVVIAHSLTLAATSRALASLHAAQRVADLTLAFESAEGALALATERIVRDRLRTDLDEWPGVTRSMWIERLSGARHLRSYRVTVHATAGAQALALEAELVVLPPPRGWGRGTGRLSSVRRWERKTLTLEEAARRP